MSAGQHIILVVDREGRWLPIGGRRVAKLTVRWDGQSTVIRVRARVVVRLVAALAGGRRVIVVAADVAFRTLVGNRDMRPGQWPNGVVVKRGRCPSRLRVAVLTGRWELRRLVVGVRRGIVIGQVAAAASVRRVVVVSIVALGALVCNRCMSANQWIVLVVNRKGRRCPAGCGRVAACTIRRQHQHLVVGVRTGIVVRCVASCAIGWCALVAVGMAVHAVRRLVTSGQWPNRVVIESIPLAGWVASQASWAVVLVAVHAVVVVVRFWVGVAGRAGEDSIVVRVRVAVNAGIPFSFVRT